MFLFNRSTRATQEQAANRTDPLRDTPTPTSMTSSERMASDHRRTQSDQKKRTSMFSGRARSRTAALAPSEGYYSAITSNASTDVSSRRSSQDDMSFTSSMTSVSVMKPESSPKWFFSRPSKRLRRQNSTLSLSSSSGSARVETPSESSPPSHYRKGSLTRSISGHARRPTISQPFNFQHLTHTEPQQFQDLSGVTAIEPVAKPSATRAAQSPHREVRGTMAHDLHFANFSSDAVNAPPNWDGHPSDNASTTIQPHSADVFREVRDTSPRDSPSPSGSAATFGHGQSASTGSIGFKGNRYLISPVVPPPRTSSRQAVTLSYDTGAESKSRSRPPTSLTSLMLTPRPATSGTPVPHAVTTPDDSAWHLKPPAFGGPGTELADVPEEEESIFSKRNSKRSSRPESSGSVLRQTQSLSDMRSMNERNISHSSLRRAAELQKQERPVSEVSDTLEGPYCPPPVKGAAGIPGSSKRLSVGLRAVEGCWEDDIDYCYEHAAEADCDYDWDRNSDDGFDIEPEPKTLAGDMALLSPKPCPSPTPASQSPPRSPKPMLPSEENPPRDVALERALRNLQPYSSSFRPSLLVPAYSPAVDPHSASTIDSDLQTPKHGQGMGPYGFNRPPSFAGTFKESDGFSLSPSLLIPSDFRNQMSQETAYEEVVHPKRRAFHGRQPSDTLESSTESISSTRSPHRRQESGDSPALSRVPSTTGRHHPSDSAGSVPELVHGSRSVRQQEFDFAAEQLADHIAALNTAEKTSELERSQSLHKRKRSLAKDVAQQTIVRKVSSSGNLIERRALLPLSVQNSLAARAPLISSAPPPLATHGSPISSAPPPIRYTGRLAKMPTYSDSMDAEPVLNRMITREPKRSLPNHTPPQSPRSSSEASRIPIPVGAVQRTRSHSDANKTPLSPPPRVLGSRVRAMGSAIALQSHA